ncbi:TetR/AcrR family transcriptional regulator [Crossiella sp. CA198]|uniref:TetR/AcrR family transcriptional regulator n=1 Tax=Crossiella sp. CA198 TaxID=3455607 RepID=UPI003F8D36BD
MPAGRPREFDVDAGLDAALRVFWRQGYAGAALTDLTEAVGVNRPSLYAAYGNKAELFRRALAHYSTHYATHLNEALAQPTAREAVEVFLRGAVTVTTTKGCPRGCLGVQGALVAGPENEEIREELAQWRRDGELALRERFRRARLAGELPSTVDPADLARYVGTVGFGMSVQATGGASRAQLERVVELTLRAWDGMVAG